MDSSYSLHHSSNSIIREVFRYIHRFKNKVFVLKIDDDLIDTPLFSLLVKDIVLIQKMGIKTILVPGTKNSIDQVLNAYGTHTDSHEDVRITTEEAMPLVKLGASNVSNFLLTLLSENGAHGVLGNWVRARELGVINGLDYLCTGKVESISIDVINNLMEDDLIPIISNIGWSAVGKSYNISSSELAVSLATSIRATKLFFIGRHKGIPAVPDCQLGDVYLRDCGVFSTLNLNQGELLLKYHEKDLGRVNAEFVRHAINACSAGVARVHFIDGSQEGILLQEIFSTTGHGTMFHTNIYANIRKGRSEDIAEILQIMQAYVDKDILIPRTTQEISGKLENLYVYEIDDGVHGCCTLTLHSESMAELEALVVDDHYCGRGIGKKLVSFVLETAKQKNLKQAFVLTTQSSDFFMNLGFRIASKDILPEAKKRVYNKNRNSKILIKDI
ncbi:MAG: amino-acid N-acetyltransferase [Fibrobacteria bacterium]|nr:amino-acid N-acetyltransferase [Fibrobacteria bacterium]